MTKNLGEQGIDDRIRQGITVPCYYSSLSVGGDPATIKFARKIMICAEIGNVTKIGDLTKI